MRFRIPLRYFFAFTHLSVFILSGILVAVITYTIAQYSLQKQKPNSISQFGEKAAAEAPRDYAIFERRDILLTRPNELNKTRVTGMVRDLASGEDFIIYVFTDDPVEKKFRRTIPTATLLTNGNVFLNGVSDLGYAVLDSSGNNLSPQFPFFRNRDFPASHVLFGDDEDFLYTLGPDKEEKHPRGIFWHRGRSIEKITDKTFPGNEFWLKPLGWSGLQQNGTRALYISKQSQQPVFGELWKIMLPEKKVTKISSVTGTTARNIRVCPEQDYAVFTAAPLDPSQGPFGDKSSDAGVGPAAHRIVLVNLLTDTSKTILSSEESIDGLILSCASRKILFRENGLWKLINHEGRRSPFPRFRSEILFFSDDGKTAAIRENGSYSLLNVKTGEKSEIGPTNQYTVIGIVRQ